MARPVALASGVYHLNVRVPGDLATKARGTRVTLPVAGTPTTVKVGDKVIVSLRTKDVATAKTRFTEAAAALQQHWAALRAGPRALPHRQVVALAGDAYRRRSTHFDLTFEPDHLEAKRREAEEALEAWRFGDDDDPGEISLESARFFEAIQRPMGPQWLAIETGADVCSPYVSITYGEALEDLFGAEADALCAERHVIIDAPTRGRLLREIARVVRLTGDRLIRMAESDYSPDVNLARFPAFEAPSGAPSKPPNHGSKLTVTLLFERWCAHNSDKKAASTARRYRPSITSLANFVKGKDVRQIDQDDIWAWAEHRRDADQVAAKTVNRNDLVAAASLFKFAATRDSDERPSGEKKRPLLSSNPVRGVRLDQPRETGKKDKVFKSAEVSAILTLTRGVANGPIYPKASASRRWAPWICAYSGARIQEVCWLRKENVWCEGAERIWVMEFPMTKDGFARIVPLHDVLIEEGFIDFWRSCSDGFLFVGDKSGSARTTMSIQEMRAGDIAKWIRKSIPLDAHLSPNHSWRHTFITKADGRMTKRMANRIAGHNKKKDASDGYFSPSVEEMKAALDNFPRFAI